MKDLQVLYEDLQVLCDLEYCFGPSRLQYLLQLQSN